MIKQVSRITTVVLEYTFTTTAAVVVLRNLDPVIFGYGQSKRLVKVWGQFRAKSVTGVGNFNTFLKLLSPSGSPIVNDPYIGTPAGFVPYPDVLINVGTAFQTMMTEMNVSGFKIDNVVLTRSSETAAGSVYEFILCFEFLESVFVPDEL